MQIESDKVLSQLESLYSQDIAAKTHEIAILRAVNEELTKQVAALQNQVNTSISNDTKKEG